MLPRMDSLSLILDDMRFDGVVFASTVNTAPWAWHLATPGLACFHIVTQGQAWLMRDHEAPALLEQGDLLVLPGGVPHRIVDRPQTTADIAALSPHLSRSEMTPVRHGGGGAECHLISGHARFDIDMAAPLIQALPTTMLVRGLGVAPPLWLAIGLQFLAQEVQARRPAQQAILNRLGDILFIECIRDHVEALPDDADNWLRALKDRALSAALAGMHREPCRAWTATDLAQLACLSRSSFAERFTAVIGMPPLTYLTRHRMRLAARQLRHSQLGVSQIALEVGYQSEAAFSQAFKREHGVPPSIWRQQARAESAAAGAAATEQGRDLALGLDEARQA